MVDNRKKLAEELGLAFYEWISNPSESGLNFFLLRFKTSLENGLPVSRAETLVKHFSVVVPLEHQWEFGNRCRATIRKYLKWDQKGLRREVKRLREELNSAYAELQEAQERIIELEDQVDPAGASERAAVRAKRAAADLALDVGLLFGSGATDTLTGSMQPADDEVV